VRWKGWLPGKPFISFWFTDFQGAVPGLSCFEWGCLMGDIQHDLWVLKGQIGETEKIICMYHMMYNLEGFHDLRELTALSNRCTFFNYPDIINEKISFISFFTRYFAENPQFQKLVDKIIRRLMTDFKGF